MNKTAIKNFAVWARNKLIADVRYKAGLLGISEKEIKPPLPQSSADAQFFDIGSREPYRISGTEIARRKRLADTITDRAKRGGYAAAYAATVEEAAYTWFNRLIAVRFMEANGYLPSSVRVLSGEGGKAEPDIVTAPFETDLDFTPAEREYILACKADNHLDELFHMLFIKQCNALNAILPELFEKTADYAGLLLNISFTDSDGVLWHLIHDVPEEDFREAVEIIGWMYQYYNTEPKQEVFDGLKKNVKIAKENIPAATQLFTPDWIVRYMVENALGRLWLEGHPNAALKAEWNYYLDEAEQTPEVSAKLGQIRKECKNLSPEDIKVIDPCMGSGHILVYAFDVLMQIYRSAGYADRDAAKLILEKNLYGLDIDRRAYQLACFALMMKARQYNRRILNQPAGGGSEKHHPAAFGGALPQEGNIRPLVYHPAGWGDGEEFGSLLRVDNLGERPVPTERQQILPFDGDYETALRVWNFKRLLSQKYDVVVTNPPYMGASGMGGKLSEFIKREYPGSKSDASTAFMEQTLYLCKPTGFMAMINIPVWMFLSSYEKLRRNILTQNTIINMLHFGRGIFGSD
ncbi:MAG: BREX-1 system adenine-specific DNA-methyltransferase PglX, partial [Synergistaceae bacterium]|nr:BREX-1 system adenine-specific DNA-methyltransferase PglX [Synergistaceae bacterium]